MRLRLPKIELSGNKILSFFWFWQNLGVGWSVNLKIKNSGQTNVKLNKSYNKSLFLLDQNGNKYKCILYKGCFDGDPEHNLCMMQSESGSVHPIVCSHWVRLQYM